MLALQERSGELRDLIKTDPDPRVRQRAQLVLLLAEGESVLGVARLFRTVPHRVRFWRQRSMQRGRAGASCVDQCACAAPRQLASGRVADPL